MISRDGSYFPKGGHSDTQNEQKASLPYGPPVYTDIHYRQTYFVSCAGFEGVTITWGCRNSNVSVQDGKGIFGKLR